MTEADVHDGLYVVVAHDSTIDETDAYGPMHGADALLFVERERAVFDAEGLDGVTLTMVRLHGPDDGGFPDHTAIDTAGEVAGA